MKIKSQIIPLDRKDVDTDLIIPADYLKGTGKEGLGKHLFQRLRDNEPDFPFNLAKYRDAEVLVAGDNFGCGSSREHAAWALKDWGVKAIIAPSFSDIFHSNALKNGLIPVVLDEEIVETIFERESTAEKLKLEIDLSQQRVVLEGGESYDFEIDPYRKHCLLNNMNDLDYLLSNLQTIRNHESKVFFNLKQL